MGCLDDPARLAALRATGLLDGAVAPSLDRLARVAARALGAPLAFVSLVDVDRQVYAGAAGLDLLPPPVAATREAPVARAFCGRVAATAEPLLLPDARGAPGAEGLGVAAYAGVPLVTADGHALGSLCALDARPRAWGPDDLALLADLAGAVVTELELRRAGQRSAAALAEREALLRQFVEHAPAAVAMFDREMRYVAASRRWVADNGPAGSAPEDLIGRCHYDLAPDIPEHWRACHRRVLAGAAERVEDDRVVRADGRVEHWRYELHPWHAADGSVGGLVMATEITTAQRASEAALRASELRFRALAETATDAIVSADARGRITFWNRAAARIFGHAEAEALGQPLGLLMPETHRDAHARGLERVAAGGPGRIAGRVLALEGVRKSGEVFPLDLAMTAYAVDGEPCFTSVIRDTTDRTRAERALRDQHALLAAVLEGTTDAMWLKDPDGVYRLINAAGARMLGRTVDEVLGHTEAALFTPESARAVRARDLAVLESGVARTEETESTSADGVGRAYLTTRAPLRDADGGITGVIGVSRDITERRRAEAALRDSEARLRLALDAAGMAAWDHPIDGPDGDGDGGARPAVADPLLAVVHPDDRARVAAARAAAVAGGGDLHVEFRGADDTLAADAAPHESPPNEGPAAGAASDRGRWYALTGRVVRDGAGRPVRLQGVRVDVTERRRLEAARARDARLALLTTQLPATLWAVDGDLRITFSSGAGLAAFGLAPGEVVGLSLPDYLGTDDAATPALAAVRRALGGHSAEYASRVGDRTYHTQVEPLRDADGAVAGALALSIDVTERRRLEEQLAHQAFHDALTGLANRALFLDRVAHALARRAGARGTGAQAGAPDRDAVLLLDLDDFKAVNDSLGHPQGDALLREVAERLRRATRGCDTVARLGGDEFAILLEGVAGADGAAPAVARIEAALRAPVRLGEGAAARPWRVRASLGVAYAAPGDTADEVLRNADVALYAAKADGKDRHAVFAPAMHAAVVARLELEADLRNAVEALRPVGGGRGAARAAAGPGVPGFRLVYQPVVDVAHGRVVAFEALLRWTRPDGTAASPADFVPLAEATGLIVPIGRWVLAEACAQAARWRAEHDLAADLRVAVNVSGRQLAECDELVVDVQAALARAALPPDALTLEMTESVLMQRSGETLAALHVLKTLGVRLAVDDFGTGYSSLAYLQRFPVDVLKIDKAFVDGVADEEGDRAIARTVVALGRALGLQTVAEGVEREDQRAALVALGCDYAQGYLFARPLEARPAGRLLAGVGDGAVLG